MAEVADNRATLMSNLVGQRDSVVAWTPAPGDNNGDRDSRCRTEQFPSRVRQTVRPLALPIDEQNLARAVGNSGRRPPNPDICVGLAWLSNRIVAK
jgi:hypothetical protein